MKLTVIILIAFFSIVFVACDKEKDVRDFANKDTLQQSGVYPDTNKINIEQEQIEADSIEITSKALIRTTMGNILIGLYGKEAPKTVNNFIGLVRKRYYNGILIHRVAKDFLIQTGDRNTRFPRKRDDWGKGGQSIYGEPFEDEINPALHSYKVGYEPGVVAMANRGPNTNTSQFFICLDEAEDLDRKWTIFGRVLEGMDVVEAINQVEIIPGPIEPNDGMPVEPIKIYSIIIKK